MRGPTIHCLVSKLSTPERWTVWPQAHYIEYPLNRGCNARAFLGLQHLPLHPLAVNLALIIPAGAHLVLNLVLEGPDDEEEVGTEHPPEHAADGVRDGETDEGLDDVEDVQDEADSSQHNPWFHKADVPLKYIDINQVFKHDQDLIFHVKEFYLLITSDSNKMKNIVLG